MEIIAYMQSGFPEKFGIPRQSGLVEDLISRVVFQPDYRRPEALRGLEDFSHIWLIWQFSQAQRSQWSPTVRPPRLGGNRRLGVFATRSPFRPNPLGLSCVRLDRIEWDTPDGPVLYVRGADLMDGTPIYDIKPYLPYTDCHPEATGGFAAQPPDRVLRVEIPPDLEEHIPASLRPALMHLLALDPRPAYQKDPRRPYGMSFSGLDVGFRVDGDCLTVFRVEKNTEQ